MGNSVTLSCAMSKQAIIKNSSPRTVGGAQLQGMMESPTNH